MSRDIQELIKSKYLLYISIILLLINLLLIFGLASFTRIVYAIFFYHVSSAWLSYLSFGISVIFHILYLKTKKVKWSYLGKNSIIVGVFFVGFTLITGSLWFNATSGGYNNIYWQWSDPRQTTTLVLFLVYLAYLLFGNLIDEREKRYKLMAVYGIVIFPTIPLSYLSAILFNSLHPLITPNPGQSGHIYWDLIKIIVLVLNLIALTIFYIYLVQKFVELDENKEKLNRIIQEKLKEV